MNRREFLTGLAAGSAAGLFFPQWVFSQQPSTARTKPDFLIILTDDQRWDALGVVQSEQGERARFPWLRTPNLDQLANSGVRFRNAFSVLSLCSPSRASFLTGQYGGHNGILNNNTEFSASNTTYATLLREAGYATGYVGKWHMGKQTERPGFDETATYVEQGAYFDCEFLVNGKAQPSSGWVDDVATEHALEFLRRHTSGPFLLTLGFKTSHDDYQPPPRHAETYAGESARPVSNLESLAIYQKASAKAASASSPASQRNRPEEILNYMRCVTAIDENIGRLLSELSQLGLERNTVVVFAGDNGFHLGEHGMFNKRDAYEESMRIPLLLRYPALEGPRVIDELVLNIDLAPTLLEMAGIAVPAAMQGSSWQPLLQGSPESWRDSVYFQYRKERQKIALPNIDAVRTDNAKLIVYEDRPEWTELYDLSADPYEIKNLAGEPEKQELKESLMEALNKLHREFAPATPASKPNA